MSKRKTGSGNHGIFVRIAATVGLKTVRNPVREQNKKNRDSLTRYHSPYNGRPTKTGFQA
jgi:hypothetical protein